MFTGKLTAALIILSPVLTSACVTYVMEPGVRSGGQIVRHGPPPPPQRVWVDPQGAGACPHPMGRGAAIGAYCDSLYQQYPPPHYGRPPVRRY